MTTISPIVKPISQMRLSPGSLVTIPNINWQEFESILAELGENRAARLAYSQGTLEIMVPLPDHKKPKDIISDIVKLLLKSTGRRYEPFGSTTFKQEGIAGVEPDACFYIQNYQQMIGRHRLKPDDPPPDLAIESDVTSKTTLDAYQGIGVPEVWVYDSVNLTIYVLQTGNYKRSDISPIFPDFPIAQIIPATIKRSWQVGHVQALEELEITISKGKRVDG